MRISDEKAGVSRRRALAIGGGAAASLAALGSLVPGSPASAAAVPQLHMGSPLVGEIERIIGAQGTVTENVLSIEIDRDDITNVTIHGVPISPSFQVNGSLYFQELGNNRVAMNSDMALKGSELNAFIDQLLIHTSRSKPSISTFTTSTRSSGSSTSALPAIPSRSHAA